MDRRRVLESGESVLSEDGGHGGEGVGRRGGVRGGGGHAGYVVEVCEGAESDGGGGGVSACGAGVVLLL